MDVALAPNTGTSAPIAGVAVVLMALTVAILAFHRAKALGRGLLALTLGSAAVIEGVGVAGAHMLRGSATDSQLSGLLSLVVGLGLLAMGAVILVAGSRGWWRLLGLPAGLAWLLYVILPLTMALIATHPPRTPVSGPTPGDSGLEFRDVTFDTLDGVRLAGWYIPSRNSAAVLALPGAGGSRSGVLARR